MTIELVPFGVGRPKLLHQAIIYNDGTGSGHSGNYEAILGRKGAKLTPISTGVRRARVEGFPRRRRNALHLLARVLQAAGYV